MSWKELSVSDSEYSQTDTGIIPLLVLDPNPSSKIAEADFDHKIWSQATLKFKGV